MKHIDPVTGGRWDDCCPHCDKKLEGLYDMWSFHGNEKEFTAACPYCDGEIRAYVHSVPEFELFKL